MIAMKKSISSFILMFYFISQFTAQTQNVGIGTLSPLAKLHVDVGTNAADGILFTGIVEKGTGFPSLGGGNRFMFYPARAALRAGMISGTEWDNVNVGVGSTAFGGNTVARNYFTLSIGVENTAGGFASSVFGN